MCCGVVLGLSLLVEVFDDRLWGFGSSEKVFFDVGSPRLACVCLGIVAP